MKKRITAVMMAAALSLLAAGVPVYASDESTLTVPISATVMSSYTVVLPSVTQTLADEDNDGTFTGTIGYDAYGKINADKALVVMVGDGTGLSYAQDIINLETYKTSRILSRRFHMLGTTGGKTVEGSVEQTVLRLLARGTETESPMDAHIPAEASGTPPFQVTMEIDIPYTDIFTGNMPFTFGLIDR